MRGVESFGMMCSPKELGLGEDHAGLMILDPSLPIGADVRPLLDLDDAIFEMEVIPNRGDWAGMIGVAREVAAMLGIPWRQHTVALAENGPAAADCSSVTIEVPELCPRYAGRILRNVKIGPSPGWLCRRLIAAGQRPINNIVDITNYVLMETGHPLHAFDLDKLIENRIVVRLAKQNETIETIDEQTRTLRNDSLVIADAQRPVAIAGIMGGRQTEVGETTTNVFLESACFDRISIRTTARAFGMITEASQRFQRGADIEMVGYALDRAGGLVQDLAGAEAAPGVLDEYPRPFKPIKLDLRYTRPDRLLGTHIEPQTQRAYLSNLGFKVEPKDEERCTVVTPSWRHDVAHEADLVEEIARLHGYDRIETTLPRVRQSDHQFAPEERHTSRLRKLLVGLGLDEFLHMTFSCEADIRRAGLNGPYLDMVRLQNPLSENHAAMRTSLIPALLSTTSANLRHGLSDIRAFEIGPVYRPSRDNDLPNQFMRVAVLLTGHRLPQHWSISPPSYDFYDIKGFAETIMEFFRAPYAIEGISPSTQKPVLDTFAPEQAALVQSNDGTPFGFLGAVSVAVLRAYDIQQPVYLLEIDAGALYSIQSPVPQFQVPSSYPPSLRDMAVVLDQAVPAGTVLATARQAGGKHLKDVRIFDVYMGEQVPAGKKSIALSLVFQSPDRTLTEKDTQKAWDAILKALCDKHQAVLR